MEEQEESTVVVAASAASAASTTRPDEEKNESNSSEEDVVSPTNEHWTPVTNSKQEEEVATPLPPDLSSPESSVTTKQVQTKQKNNNNNNNNKKKDVTTPLPKPLKRQVPFDGLPAMPKEHHKKMPLNPVVEEPESDSSSESSAIEAAEEERQQHLRRRRRNQQQGDRREMVQDIEGAVEAHRELLRNIENLNIRQYFTVDNVWKLLFAVIMIIIAVQLSRPNTNVSNNNNQPEGYWFTINGKQQFIAAEYFQAFIDTAVEKKIRDVVDEEEEEEEEESNNNHLTASRTVGDRSLYRDLVSDHDETMAHIAGQMDHFKASKGLAFVQNATDFLRGYARMATLCDEMVNLLGLRSLVEGADGDALMSEPLYLASGSVYSPYFCVNMPIDILFSNSKSSVLKHAESEVGLNLDNHRQLHEQWQRKTANGALAATNLRASDVFSTSPLHLPSLMGYFSRYMYVRDLEALGHEPNNTLSLKLLHYKDLIASVVDQATLEEDDNKDEEESSGKKKIPQCMCGPHLGLARHIVFYFLAGKHANLYVEPVITSQNAYSTIQTTTLPWTYNTLSAPTPLEKPVTDSEPKKNRKSKLNAPKQQQQPAPVPEIILDRLTPYQRIEFLLRNETGLKSMRCGNSLLVDAFKFSYEQEDKNMMAFARDGKLTPPKVPVVNGARWVWNVEGNEAHCLCYCEQLAYAIKHHVDAYDDEDLVID